ncbi:hypothetical protein RSOL_499060 [Rhizoctonia solani AG-3 Rhs1AP]|uniref:Uncharacterized protein n=1 Tax=Rhizoctonia solani AG-3 Rhs1AP TaxID=1086054 RepID=X8JVN4_9AGAM|nr:hypothetical protein RSOL_499060 [Rhizoctonia solani AG-3 Rhs1AP]
MAIRLSIQWGWHIPSSPPLFSNPTSQCTSHRKTYIPNRVSHLKLIGVTFSKRRSTSCICTRMLIVLSSLPNRRPQARRQFNPNLLRSSSLLMATRSNQLSLAHWPALYWRLSFSRASDIPEAQPLTSQVHCRQSPRPRDLPRLVNPIRLAHYLRGPIATIPSRPPCFPRHPPSQTGPMSFLGTLL